MRFFTNISILDLFLFATLLPYAAASKGYGERGCCYKDDSRCSDSDKCGTALTCSPTCYLNGQTAFFSCTFIPNGLCDDGATP
ncbi:hypothetical protein AG0111_0g9456 [Alternaria gaisen]|uniref:Uncharacterized protein n=1 Tax=Alternaria gaisen TaxID=167740 RepID=A0ACB6FCA2_9PLEO|nr:hypothetical protein AG0111_0g9456 [Alternaria gaisen]